MKLCLAAPVHLFQIKLTNVTYQCDKLELVNLQAATLHQASIYL